jgi:hypothetical protein
MAMIDNRIEPFARAFEPSQTLSYDEICIAFAESVEPLLQLANLAYAYSSIGEQVPTGRSPALGRVGMRAVDLLTELIAFIESEM